MGGEAETGVGDVVEGRQLRGLPYLSALAPEAQGA